MQGVDFELDLILFLFMRSNTLRRFVFIYGSRDSCTHTYYFCAFFVLFYALHSFPCSVFEVRRFFVVLIDSFVRVMCGALARSLFLLLLLLTFSGFLRSFEEPCTRVL
jgi:hypothetical protein